MSFLAPVAGAAASGLITGGLSSVFGGNKKSATSGLQSFGPAGFNAGGLSASFGNNAFNVTPTADRLAAIGNVAGALGAQADEIGSLRPTLAPGISGLRAARLAEIENARAASVSNLRDNLQRRRVLGSSFGEDALTRANAEFAQQRERVAGESFLQEFEGTVNLINQEFTARRAQFQTFLDELNLEANVAASLSGKATEVLQKNAAVEAQLLALQAQNKGTFFGSLFQPVGKAAGTAVTDLFKGFNSRSGGLDPSFGLQF